MPWYGMQKAKAKRKADSKAEKQVRKERALTVENRDIELPNAQNHSVPKAKERGPLPKMPRARARAKPLPTPRARARAKLLQKASRQPKASLILEEVPAACPMEASPSRPQARLSFFHSSCPKIE